MYNQTQNSIANQSITLQQSQATKLPEVAEQMEENAKSIETIFEFTKKLEAMLSPVLRQEPAAPGVKRESKNITTPLASALSQQGESLSSILDGLCYIISRIEV